ncbi:penicillin-binding transpeptidase domain-containing protein, partial [Bacillus pumilus]|uniref:penicillin-binding transpeptidase domain-containing protein n=1 Tax=Bacillus pumilus TaxID=1408 RepID=UPI0037046962
LHPKTPNLLPIPHPPTFNLNQLHITNYNNDLISYAFQPASTINIFTLPPPIQQPLYQPNHKYQSPTYKLRPPLLTHHNNPNPS